MFMRRLLTALLATTLALPVFAANTLVLPEKSKLLVLDGKNTEALKQITLDNGRHQIVFQLKSLIREGGDTKMFSSSPYIMTFDLSGDQIFTVNGPKLKTARDTSKLSYSTQSHFSMTDQKGKTIPFEFSVLNKSGLLIGASTVEDIQKFNLSDNPAAVRELAGTVYIATPYAAPTRAKPATATDQPMSETMLQYWFNQADENTRTRFLQWASELAGK